MVNISPASLELPLESLAVKGHEIFSFFYVREIFQMGGKHPSPNHAFLNQIIAAQWRMESCFSTIHHHKMPESESENLSFCVCVLVSDSFQFFFPPRLAAWLCEALMSPIYFVDALQACPRCDRGRRRGGSLAGRRRWRNRTEGCQAARCLSGKSTRCRRRDGVVTTFFFHQRHRGGPRLLRAEFLRAGTPALRWPG